MNHGPTTSATEATVAGNSSPNARTSLEWRTCRRVHRRQSSLQVVVGELLPFVPAIPAACLMNAASFAHPMSTTSCSVPIFFDSRQCLSAYEQQWPPSTGPCRFVSAAQGRYAALSVHEVCPAIHSDLYLAHDREYVDSVMAGRRSNGYENNDPRVVEASLWAVGAMVQAAFHAPETPSPVLVPCSGFRQAGYAEGGAFSTFNGIAVAAGRFLAEHPSATIGILDCANGRAVGTEDILAKSSNLSKQVLFISSACDYVDCSSDELAFLDWLDSALEKINNAGCSLVFYVAGSEFLLLGTNGVRMSMTGQMLRDRRVFSRVRAPVVWSLAGGYGIQPRSDGIVIRSSLMSLGEASMSIEWRQRDRSRGRWTLDK